MNLTWWVWGKADKSNTYNDFSSNISFFFKQRTSNDKERNITTKPVVSVCNFLSLSLEVLSQFTRLPKHKSDSAFNRLLFRFVGYLIGWQDRSAYLPLLCFSLSKCRSILVPFAFLYQGQSGKRSKVRVSWSLSAGSCWFGLLRAVWHQVISYSQVSRSVATLSDAASCHSPLFLGGGGSYSSVGNTDSIF